MRRVTLVNYLSRTIIFQVILISETSNVTSNINQ